MRKLMAVELKNGSDNFKPEIWITAYPIPYSQRLLILTDEGIKAIEDATETPKDLRIIKDYMEKDANQK